jgi:hypothetical protein
MEITTKYSPAAKLVTSIVTDGTHQVRNTTTDRLQAIGWLASNAHTNGVRAAQLVRLAINNPGIWVQA